MTIIITAIMGAPKSDSFTIILLSSLISMNASWNGTSFNFKCAWTVANASTLSRHYHEANCKGMCDISLHHSIFLEEHISICCQCLGMCLVMDVSNQWFKYIHRLSNIFCFLNQCIIHLGLMINQTIVFIYWGDDTQPLIWILNLGKRVIAHNSLICFVTSLNDYLGHAISIFSALCWATISPCWWEICYSVACWSSLQDFEKWEMVYPPAECRVGWA